GEIENTPSDRVVRIRCRVAVDRLEIVDRPHQTPACLPQTGQRRQQFGGGPRCAGALDGVVVEPLEPMQVEHAWWLHRARTGEVRAEAQWQGLRSVPV